MRRHRGAGLIVAVAAVALAACADGSDAEPIQVAGGGVVATSAQATGDVPMWAGPSGPTGREAASRKAALIDAATSLNHLAPERQYEEAWKYYSQRCKNIIGGLDTYGHQMDYLFKDRDPEWAGVTVRINGASAQVVSVDKSPAAPAGAMNPRTWTFIDGRWQFDNC